MTKKMVAYAKAKHLFMECHPLCQLCPIVRPNLNATEKAMLFGEHKSAFWATDIHHCAGRLGQLLMDETRWRSACRSCHAYVHGHPAWAREVGLIAGPGEWGKQS